MLQAQRNRRFEKTELVAAIETPARKAQPVKGLTVIDQSCERIGQLDLPAAAGLGPGEMAENFRLNDIAADNRRR